MQGVVEVLFIYLQEVVQEDLGVQELQEYLVVTVEIILLLLLLMVLLILVVVVEAQRDILQQRVVLVDRV